jgi:RNA polymerase sigma-70 factor (ECF subfamily)
LQAWHGERCGVDEPALMEGVRARDARAFEALYDAYHRLVYGIALRVLSDARAAEDVTQTVFLKLWSSPDVFRGGNFPGWIARVTRNRAIDVLRSNAGVSGEEFPALLAADDVLEEQVIAALDGRRVREAMKRIPHDQREVIELGFFGGLSHEQIARRAGLPLGTVKTRIRSGLRKLRAELEGARVV